MKRLTFLLVTLLTVSISTASFGQEKKTEISKEQRKEQFEKIEAAKREFFKQELTLSDAEMDKFWTVYTDFRKNERKNKKEIHTLTKELRTNFETLSDSDVKAKTEAIHDLESKALDLKKKYVVDATKIIGAKKTAKSLYLEHEFRKKLKETLDKRPHGKQGLPMRSKDKATPALEKK